MFLGFVSGGGGMEEDLRLLKLQCTFIREIVVGRFLCGKKR